MPAHGAAGRRWWPALLLMLGMLAATLDPSVGAAKQQSASPVATPIDLEAATPAASPIGSATNATGVTFRELGYGDLTAQMMDSSLSYFFPRPAGTTVSGNAELRLIYSHSPLLVPDRSTMTVVVNGQSLTSVLLTGENQNRAELSVPLPLDALTGEVLAVTLRFHLRLTRDECEEVQNAALWATVHGDSTLSLATSPSSDAVGLEDLDALFTPTGVDPTPITLVLPPDPSPEELEAAGLIAFQIGRWAGAVQRDPVLAYAATEGDLPDGPAIVIGTGAALTPEGWGSVRWVGETFMIADETLPAEHGVLAIRMGSGPQLLVSGTTPGAVLSAATAVVRPELRHLLAGGQVAVAGTSVPPIDGVYAWREGAASFAQLGVERRDVAGIGEHFLDVTFDRPAEWVLRDGGSLLLDLETSPSARTETSWVAVSVNGTLIGTQALRPRGVGASNRYTFVLPAGLLNSDLQGQPVRRLALQVRIFLDAERDVCEPVDPAGAWAALLPTSAWILPHDEHAGLDLGRFPAPVLAANGEVPVSVVLPDAPSASQLTAGLSMQAAMGRWATNAQTVLPRLVWAGSVTEDEREATNLVLIGGPESNTLTQLAAAERPEAFDSPHAAVIDPAAARGEVRLLRSPWAEERTVLVVSTNDPARIAEVAEALTESDVVLQLQGQLATVQRDLPVQPLLATDPAPGAPAELAPFVVEPSKPITERIEAWQIIGAIALLLVLALLIIIVIFRWLRPKRAT